MSVYTLGQLQDDPELLRVPERLLKLPAFRGCITLLSGREKVGKTEKLSQEVAEASSRLRVLWLAIDEWKGFVVQRLTIDGADSGLLIEDARLEVSELRSLIQEHHIDLCIIDTLREFASGIVEDSADDMQWTPLMSALRTMAQETGAAIVLVHHNAKGSNDYSGSTAIAAGSDVLVNMKVDGDPDSTRRSFTVKARLPATSYTEDRIKGRYVRLEVDPQVDLQTVEDRIVAYVTLHPGCALNAVKMNVAGCRTQVIGETVKELLGAGHLVNRGKGRGKALHIGTALERSPERSSTPPGDYPGITSGIWGGIVGIAVGLSPGSTGTTSGIASDPAPRRDDRGSSPSPRGRNYHLSPSGPPLSDEEIELLATQHELAT